MTLDSSLLRILHLEDEPHDAELVAAALEGDGLPCEIIAVSTRQAFTDELTAGRPDVILSDFSLPGFDGLSALQIARRIAPEVPFLFVSGTIGEEAAISGVRNGATDYVLKHRLSRLAPAVRRAAGEAAELKRRKAAEEQLRRSEEQLRQSQKMDAIGRLAGGVAHDFNNMLTVIMGYSQLMLTTMNTDDPQRKDVEEIERAAERSASLTRQLLAFSRQQVLDPKVLDLNVVITEADKMLRRLIGADINLFTAPAEILGRVKVDPGQVDQIIMNLVVNARDAMPEGGKLTIETANVQLDESYTQSHVGVRPGSYVMLAVSDTGCGMDAETKSRIFEPFFTTKEVGKGTGLGLSTVYGIVRQSEGHIEVYSEPGAGSAFKVYFPRIEAQGESSRTIEVLSHALQGSETILLVEDEDQVRLVLSQILHRHGYRIVEARNGAEALKVYQSYPDRVDLLLTDIVMPEIGGPELVRRLAELEKDVPTLYISGYTDKAIVHHGLLGAGHAFVQKPFTPEGLLHKVRDVLDRRRSKAA